MSHEFAEKNIAGGWPHFVAICDGRVVGWCDISSMDRPVFEHAGVLGMGIIKGYRGIGIGEALIRAAIAKAESKGLKRIELTVRAPNVSAFKLYKKVGFIEEGRHRSAILVDGNYEDLISMGLLF